MPQEKIIIKFEPKGHKPLLKALRDLTKAQQALEGKLVQGKVAGDKFAESQHLVKHRMSSNTKGANMLSGAFATLRNKLLLASFAATMAAIPLFQLVKAQSDAEEIANKFNVVFGKQTDIVREWANALGTSVEELALNLNLCFLRFKILLFRLGFLERLQHSYLLHLHSLL